MVFIRHGCCRIALSCALVLLMTVQYPGQAAAQYAGGPLMDASIPYIGADDAARDGHDGKGIIVAVIDTGISFDHPDLFHMGKNFSDDNNGHGTGVAGIISANGQLLGIVPGAVLLSYKISDDGEGVSTESIVHAIEMAVADGADVINISLGVNRTNSDIDVAITRAVAAGVVVVAAAGNDGPAESSIGSPGINPNAITVGATHNNVSSSVVVVLEIAGEYFNAAPMIGTVDAEGPIGGEVVFVSYARESDFLDGEYGELIVLAERGGESAEEKIYFTEKEAAASAAGALAIIVYNNEDGMFFGDLQHNNTAAGYEPSILAVSVSREDGLEIKDLAEDGALGRLETHAGIDTVAPFSSRGPVSPFYIKPDLVAPGTYINTTSTDGGYSIASGTSFATPHVTGVVAALLDKNPHLTPVQVQSILATTADYGGKSSHTEGGGRLNATRALVAGTIAVPHQIALHVSPASLEAVGEILLGTVDGKPPSVQAVAEISDPAYILVEADGRSLTVRAGAESLEPASYFGRILLEDGSGRYSIPVMLTVTNGSVQAHVENGTLYMDTVHPHDWSYAKITVENPYTGWSKTLTATPDSPASVPVTGNGTYWISAAIDSAGSLYAAYATAESGPYGLDTPSVWPTIPYDAIGISAVVLVAGLLFYIMQRR